MLTFLFNPFFKSLIPHKRFKGIKGGRSSGKTTFVAKRFVLLSYCEKAIFLCCRETQKSIKDSSYASIKKAVEKTELTKYFIFLQDKIICTKTGSIFLFVGLRINVDNIRSMEQVKYVWIEEAHSVSSQSLEVLTPTIRENNSEIWATWNPKRVNDPIALMFENYRENSTLIHINYLDNPFLPDASKLEISMCKKHMSEEFFNHVWLGSPRDDGASRHILPYSFLMKAKGAAKKLNYIPTSHYFYCGLDVADGGADKPAYAVRCGSNLVEVKEMTDNNGYDIAKTLIPALAKYRIARCYYDAIGVGASMKAEFKRLEGFKKLPFYPEPFLAGGKVKGENIYYTTGIFNKQFFARLNSQAWWNLRLRLENTIKALNGEKINLDYCLFLPENASSKLIDELHQIEYDYDINDKIIINKAPENKSSPNMGDAVMMSFARDLKNGLKLF